MEKNNDKPKLRFPGFTDPWEQRKLGEIVERVTRKNTELESTLPLTISAQYGLVDQISFFNKRVASRDVSGYYLLRKGEFAYNKSYSEGYPWGAVKRLERYENGALSTLYICFKLANINSDFLVSYYETNNWYKEVAKRASEGARNHGLLNIAADDFFDTELAIPGLKEEQATIGRLFQSLNNLITLHQRKLNNLQIKKKNLLQEMFPKNGEDVPELRFQGFTHPWEQCKFGDVTNLLTGYSFESKQFVNEGIPLIRGMNVKRNYLDMSKDNCEYWPSYNGLEKYLLEENDILIQMDGALIGKSYARIEKNQLPALLVQRVTRVRSKEDEIDNDFIYQSIQQGFLRHISGIKTETAVPHLSLNDIRNFEIMIPKYEEQIKISLILNYLDNLITLHHRKLNHLKEQKKSLLQQMFI